MPILTLVTPNPQPDFDMWVKTSHPDIAIADRVILDECAVQWRIEQNLSKAEMDVIRDEFKIDLFQTSGAPIKLLMADMDSTIVVGETLDDMAAAVGIGDKIAAITDRAMRGELDFEAALLERVSLLKGMSEDLIAKAVSDLQYNKGAVDLLIHLKAKGVHCVLVSGGFKQFTSHVGRELGFDDNHGNGLVMKDGALTGDVERPILDKDFKLSILHTLQSKMNLTADNIMAIGDGANDLPMLSAAGVGVAYYGKPILRDTLMNQINYTDLSALEYLV